MTKETKRNLCGVRLDLIPPELLLQVAEVFAEGATKYGEYNWQETRNKGDKSAMNHVLKHVMHYQAKIPDDESDDLRTHLTHAIVNLMFELWWENKELKEKEVEPVSNLDPDEIAIAAGPLLCASCREICPDDSLHNEDRTAYYCHIDCANDVPRRSTVDSHFCIKCNALIKSEYLIDAKGVYYCSGKCAGVIDV